MRIPPGWDEWMWKQGLGLDPRGGARTCCYCERPIPATDPKPFCADCTAARALPEQGSER